MRYTFSKLRNIFGKTDGKCRCCGKRLVFENHSTSRDPNGWEVDHDIPKSRGGTNRVDNLWPMCVNCNWRKSSLTWDEFKKHCPAAQSRRRGKGKTAR